MSQLKEKPRVYGNGNNSDDDDQLEHVCSYTDPDVSLCGKDISNEPWNHGGPVCQACVYIAQVGPGAMN